MTNYRILFTVTTPDGDAHRVKSFREYNTDSRKDASEMFERELRAKMDEGIITGFSSVYALKM